MRLESLLSHSQTCTRLKSLLTAKTSAHLYIFVAPTEHASSITAKAFLLDWLEAPSSQEHHPDLFELFCSGKAGLHSVNKIRELLEDISLTPHNSKGRAILIHSAERMLPSSSNSLLKVLEEPPPRTLIILATCALQRILPTIASRSQIIRLQDIAQQEVSSLQILPDAFDNKSIHAHAEILSKLLEEELDAFEKDVASPKEEDLSAAARHEVEQDAEAALTLFSQQRSRDLLEQAYLALRERKCPTPDVLTICFLQALKSIEKGCEFKRTYFLFLSENNLTIS